ncbi:MAG: N-acetylneuraminate synthase family protein [Patescibacteria group bacterium]
MHQIWEKIQKGVFVIAEAGKNFIQTEEDRPVSEYLKNAKGLVDAAKVAGADAIKFQTHNVEDEQLNIEIISPHFKGADRYRWLTRNTNATPVEEFWKPLKKYCEEIGIIFMSTPMSRGAALRLAEVGVPVWKIGSGDMLDFVAMDFMRSQPEPIIMSSGMSTFEEVELGFRFLQKKNSRVALMHAFSKYPGAPEEANLGTIDFYRERFSGTPIGFSENSIGWEPSAIAAAMGVTMIEKHFTISRGFWGADHKVSSTREEFGEMVNAIRTIERDPKEKSRWLAHPKFNAIYGKKEKVLRKDEEAFRPIFRKSLIAGTDIPKGAVIMPEMVYAMRPQKYSDGLPSEQYERVVGKRAARDLNRFDPITHDVVNVV